MRNFQYIFETRKRSLISVFSFCIIVPLHQDLLIAKLGTYGFQTDALR